MKLKDQVVLVTGASRGLGREIARQLAQRGARLVLVARGESLAGVAEELGRVTDVLAVRADVGEDAEDIVERSLARYGRIDVLVNNASALGPSPMPGLEQLRWEDLRQTLHTNVLAPLHLAQMVLPGMRARGRGIVVNVSSDAAVNAYPGWGGYGVSKAALEHLSRILAVELEGSGVRVLVVDPGDMNTQMHQDAEPGVDLSHLPGPEVPAPAFIYLLEQETAAFGRFEAQAISKGSLNAPSGARINGMPSH